MRLLLINPKYPESFWSFRWALDCVLPGKRAINPPLGLATIAALCPRHWAVEIVDENIEPVPLRPDVDLIGICGMGVQCARQRELVRYYRARGYFVAVGGSYVSLCPEAYRGLADAMVVGEAEYVWPRFCRDFEAGHPDATYRETGVVDLAHSPIPRFDLLHLPKYTTATLQFSRGCPYRCEFCDIIVMFGRKPRCKGVAQVEQELDALRAAGARNAFFVDDNLIGNRPAAKSLLRALAAYQARNAYPFRFGTEASINVAQDAELLGLMRAARFEWLFIGIESPDPQTLRDTRKVQNTYEDVLTSVRRIYGYGIDVLGGFIVGFDNDTPLTFDRLFRFVVHSGIQAAMVGLLTALPGTPLYQRLGREGRLRARVLSSDNTKASTNIVPLHMSYETMIEGYRRLHRQLASDRAIAQRIRTKLRHMREPLYVGEYTRRERLGIVSRLIVRGVLPGGPRRIVHFLRTLPLLTPRKLPVTIMDWIAGLAMQDYVRRHLEPHADIHANAAALRISLLRRSLASYIRAGQVALSVAPSNPMEVLLVICATVDRAFFVRSGRHLRRLLAACPSRITLEIGEMLEWNNGYLERLLQRLSRYGDRVSVIAGEGVRQRLRIDWSRFNWVLESGG